MALFFVTCETTHAIHNCSALSTAYALLNKIEYDQLNPGQKELVIQTLGSLLQIEVELDCPSFDGSKSVAAVHPQSSCKILNQASNLLKQFDDYYLDNPSHKSARKRAVSNIDVLKKELSCPPHHVR